MLFFIWLFVVTAPPSPLTLSNNTAGLDILDHSGSGRVHHTSTLPHHSSLHGPGGTHHTNTLPHNALSHQQSNTIGHHHTLPIHHQASRSSPPLPPPPLPEEDQHPRFGQPSSGRGMPIVSDELDLPGWVPKNYIEKGWSIITRLCLCVSCLLCVFCLLSKHHIEMLFFS